MVWHSHLFQNFPQLIVIHAVKGFGIVNKAERDVFSGTLLLFDDPEDVGNLISGSSAFSKTTQAQGQWLRGATPCPRSGGCVDAGGPRGATPRSRSGGVAVRRYPSSKVRSSGCVLLEQP